MKKMIFTLVALFMMTVSTKAISYTQARDEALFLTDKMAYELNLSKTQYDAVYEINLDYMMALGSYADISGTYWTRRNLDLSYVLTAAQYNKYKAASYFYRPVSWSSGWTYNIYTRYTNRSKFYYSRPTVYATYNGAHSWRNNGNRSWYRGRTFDSKVTMAPARTGTTNRPVADRTTGRNRKTANVTGMSTGSWRQGTTTTRPSGYVETTNRVVTTKKTATTTTTTTSGRFGGKR